MADIFWTTDVVHKTALPCVLVGCKCDHHPAHRQVDPAVVEQRAKTLVGELPAFRSSDGSPESQRLCLSVMLRAILASRQGELVFILVAMLLLPLLAVPLWAPVERMGARSGWRVCCCTAAAVLCVRRVSCPSRFILS